jgi:hypothetical protein
VQAIAFVTQYERPRRVEKLGTYDAESIVDAIGLEGRAKSWTRPLRMHSPR